MTATWLTATPALLASLILLLGPGLLTGYALRLRGLWLWGLAPVFSIAALTASSVLLPWLGLMWTPWIVLCGMLSLLAAFVLLYRLLLRTAFRPVSDSSTTRSDRKWTGIALTIAIGLLTGATVIGIGAGDAISQTLDNLFHLGAIRYIIETGNASPLWLSTFIDPEASSSFYPSAWHAAIATVSELSGVGIPSAITMFNLGVTVAVWPIGILLLVRQLAPRNPYSAIATGVLTASFPAFPLNLLTYGVLYPYLLGLALVPVTLALFLQLIRLTRDVKIGRSDLLLLTGVLACAGIGLSHPSAFMSWLALATPMAVLSYVTHLRRMTWLQRIVMGVTLFCFLVFGVLLLRSIRTSFQWPAQTDTLSAITQAVTGSYLGTGLTLVVGALALTGVTVSIVRREVFGLAAAAIWATGALLYISAAGIEHPLVRRFVAAWYADTPRLGALAVITIVPIAVIGFAWLCEQCLRLPRFAKPTTATISAVLLLAIIATSGYSGFLQQMRYAYDAESFEYIDTIPEPDRGLLGNLAPDGEYVGVNNALSSDERALLSRVADHVPNDATIAGNPWTGTSLAYALEGHQILIPYVTSPVTPSANLILQEFSQTPDSPEMCQALEETGVSYILDFGTREVHSGSHSFPGIENLDRSSAVDLVDQEGVAKLFRITSCGLD